MRISVIGGGTIDEEDTAVAHRVGELLGERGHTLVCGGRTGVMEAACRGAKETGGTTIGILPSTDPNEANAYVDVPIATGIGNARNVLVALNGEGVIAIDGSYGTLSEIAHALDFGRPVAGIASHDVAGVETVETPEAAVKHVENA
ncbi:DNA recombination-mediator protein A [Halalkalicoccus paucihalophilus]|uniref:DNA recombination-mediator protein A n=1 Tax=Halalkalicoccus paucihalophilus TaxID=1008153 RepID=A0A151AHF7_9EURY|nr:TIGR00725 family protein [Halalkalicoccus paucihalophilus]KYH27069.1 DNA recombination-mediator protein A [Halalkalicoccus paucihalophilus]